MFAEIYQNVMDETVWEIVHAETVDHLYLFFVETRNTLVELKTNNKLNSSRDIFVI